MNYIVISNNPLAKLKASDLKVSELSILPVLEKVRDMVHVGHHLLTHPFAGSVKPNENPFKSVVITKEQIGVDISSVQVIERCLEFASRMLREKPYRQFSPQEISGLMILDKCLLDSGLDSLK